MSDTRTDQPPAKAPLWKRLLIATFGTPAALSIVSRADKELDSNISELLNKVVINFQTLSQKFWSNLVSLLGIDFEIEVDFLTTASLIFIPFLTSQILKQQQVNPDCYSKIEKSIFKSLSIITMMFVLVLFKGIWLIVFGVGSLMVFVILVFLPRQISEKFIQTQNNKYLKIALTYFTPIVLIPISILYVFIFTILFDVYGPDMNSSFAITFFYLILSYLLIVVCVRTFKEGNRSLAYIGLWVLGIYLTDRAVVLLPKANAYIDSLLAGTPAA